MIELIELNYILLSLNSLKLIIAVSFKFTNSINQTVYSF